jgi:hypothetical protein
MVQPFPGVAGAAVVGAPWHRIVIAFAHPFDVRCQYAAEVLFFHLALCMCPGHDGGTPYESRPK